MGAAAATFLATVAGAGGAARADRYDELMKTPCNQCGLGQGLLPGLTPCRMCNGQGVFKNFSVPDEDEDAPPSIGQYVECPDCMGKGTKICEVCYGTALPTSYLGGFLRREAWQKFNAYIKYKGLSPDNMDEVQDMVRSAVKEEERLAKERAAAPQQGFSLFG